MHRKRLFGFLMLIINPSKELVKIPFDKALKDVIYSNGGEVSATNNELTILGKFAVLMKNGNIVDQIYLTDFIQMKTAQRRWHVITHKRLRVFLVI